MSIHRYFKAENSNAAAVKKFRNIDVGESSLRKSTGKS